MGLGGAGPGSCLGSCLAPPLRCSVGTCLGSGGAGPGSCLGSCVASPLRCRILGAAGPGSCLGLGAGPGSCLGSGAHWLPQGLGTPCLGSGAHWLFQGRAIGCHCGQPHELLAAAQPQDWSELLEALGSHEAHVAAGHAGSDSVGSSQLGPVESSRLRPGCAGSSWVTPGCAGSSWRRPAGCLCSINP